MSEFYNDGAVPHGGFLATFATAGVLKVENFNVEDPGKVTLRPDEIGSPNGFVGVEDQMTATATVQIPDATGSLLLKGDHFTASAPHGGAKWIVTRIGTRYQMNDYWKQEVSFHRAMLS